MIYNSSQTIYTKLSIFLLSGSFFTNPCKKSADPLSDQSGDFSIIGESLAFSNQLRIDQLAVTFYIKDAATAFDQFDIGVRILCLQFCLHTGSFWQIVSYATIFDNNVHDVSLAIHPLLQFLPHLEKWQPFRSHLSLFPVLRIPPRISAVFPHCEAPECPNLNSPTLLERIGEPVKDHVDYLECIIFSQVLFDG
jgi:hypothetical protein